MNYIKDEVVKMLEEGVRTVTFTKKDGSKRVMKASLLKEDLEGKIGATSSTRASNSDVVCCVDTEKGEWRSFRLDSIVSIE